MEHIRIEDQPVLSLRRTLRLTTDGIRYRLFRSIVTVAVIAVAIAFLSNVVSESLFKRSVALNTRERIEDLHLAHFWSARLSAPGSSEEILREFADVQKNDDVYTEYQVLGGLSDEQLTELHLRADQATKYLDFFGDLRYDRRRDLIHTALGVEIFDRLTTLKGMGRFRRSLSDMKSVRFIGFSKTQTPMEDLEDFTKKWPEVREMTVRIKAGRVRAIKQVNESLAGRTPMEALADADGAFGDVVRAAGFGLGKDVTAPKVAAQVRNMQDKIKMEKSIGVTEMQQAMAARKDVLLSEVTTPLMWQIAKSRRGAAWYLAKMEENGLDTAGLDVEKVVMLAKGFDENRALARAERLTMGATGNWMGLGPRMGWLLIVSMLVCAVGICNAMLMSVTERFREIATLKCLGALDGFIMLVFVLESSFLGIVGGLLGAALGSVIGIGRMLFSFGVRFAAVTPVSDVVVSVAAAVGVGMVLAAIAAVYPAYKAARLAPMEAMRIE